MLRTVPYTVRRGALGDLTTFRNFFRTKIIQYSRYYLICIFSVLLYFYGIQLTIKFRASPGAAYLDVADLKWRLTAAWSGLQEHVIDEANDQQR